MPEVIAVIIHRIKNIFPEKIFKQNGFKISKITQCITYNEYTYCPNFAVFYYLIVLIQILVLLLA